MILRLCVSTVCSLHIFPKKPLLVSNYRSLFTRCLLPTAGNMKSQSSITSFFSAKSKKPSDAENADDAASKSGRVEEKQQLSPKLKGKRPAADVSDSDSTSPVKKPRRRRAVIESDSDEDAARDGSGAKSPSVKSKGTDKEPARQKSEGSPHGAGKPAGDESAKSVDEPVSANGRGSPKKSPDESVVSTNGKTSPNKASPQKNKSTDESVPANGKGSPKKAAPQKSKSVPLRKTARKKPIRSVATEEKQKSVISQVAPELLVSAKPDQQSSTSTDEPEKVGTNGDSHVTDTAEENGDEVMSSPSSKEKEEPDAPKVQTKTKSKAATRKESSPKAKVEQRPSAGIFGRLSGQETGAGGKSAADDGNEYDPSRKKYHPVEHAVWARGDKVPYLALARTFELVESISGRLKTIEVVSNYFRSVMVLSPEDLLPSVYLCLNQLAPAYHGVELGIGDMVITRALAQATGRTPDKIKRDVAEKGDLGLVAESSKSNQRVMFRPAALTVQTVFRTLKEIAQLSGHSVMNKKVGKIQSLLVACRHAETRFVVRSLTGKLRIGLAEQSVLHALGQACAMTPPSQQLPLEVPNQLVSLSADKIKASIDHAAMLIKTAHCECPTYDEIIPVLLEHGVEELPKHCRIRPGVPLKPMLAHPTKGVSEVLSRFEGARFTCEYKYDGERAQIHLCEDGTINVYSRNQENNTTKYPDIIARFRSCLTPDVRTCILDTEAVAWDTEKQQILPFQVLSTRKRKDADSASIKIQVQVFAFDLLYLNGESLVADTFQTRRDKLRSSFKAVDGEFTFAKSMDSNNVEEMAEFLDESVKGNCEGLMVKTLERDATYEIAKRSRNWLKLKKDYLEGVGDTIDVVVIGGFLGKGKRAGVYGGFLLACYDPENEEFQSICKIGTGFSDDDLQQHSVFFKDHLIESAKSYYRYSVEPDHWFDAVQVWEIKCADLSVSPVHKAAVGLVDPERGISLRFPRFLRIRDDKPPEQATSAQQVADMYNGQDQVKNQTSSGRTVDDEDFY